MSELPGGGLVLYKRRPACVKVAGAGRLEIEEQDGQLRKVRPKDVVLLHPGPCTLRDLQPPAPVEEVETVRDLLFGEACDLATLSELLYGDATPATSWASWQLVEEGLHFTGSPEAVEARSAQDVAEDRERHHRRQAETEAWTAFVERVRQSRSDPADAQQLRPVEELALGRRPDSRLLKELGRAETPENAHALLLDQGAWSAADLPYAARAGLPTDTPAAIIGDLPTAARTDLTHMTALAIDDEGNRDPDDAVSLDEDGRLWVHVADVAALLPPDSPADIEARARGATLYLPHGQVPMLPPAAVQQLGLGLPADGRSPALSFGMDVDDRGAVTGCRVEPSTVRVERLTYEQAQSRLQDGDAALADLRELTERARRRRLVAGAVDLQWPEVRIRVTTQGPEPEIDIQPLVPLESRTLVSEAMILAGEGVAALARRQAIPVPFSVQESLDEDEIDSPAPRVGLAAALALRKRQRPARTSGEGGRHRGLGLELYTRATSPLRRYHDLLVHQQLRAAVTDGQPLELSQVVERAAQAEAAAGAVRSTERLANRHWTLVWLQQRPGWRGLGELVDTRGRRGLLVIPELALETTISLPSGAEPGQRYEITVRGVDLPRLDLHLDLES